MQNLGTDDIGLRLLAALNPGLKIFRTLSEEQNSKLLAITCLLADLLRARNNVLDQVPQLNVDGDSNFYQRRTQNVEEYVEYLRTIEKIANKLITNHTEEETKKASSLILPFI